jgi:hypothetical protein
MKFLRLFVVLFSLVPFAFADTVGGGAIHGPAAIYLPLSGGTVTGNVGIGGSPTFLLDLIAAGQVNLRLNNTTNTVRARLITDTTSFLIQTDTLSPIKFAINNGAAVATIDTSGNVGIANTPSGTYKLEVTGNISGTTLYGAVNASTATFSGAVTSTKACDSGYVRLNPNYCYKNSDLAYTIISALTCTAITTPASAKAVRVKSMISLSGNGVVGAMTGSLTFHSENTCATPRGYASAAAYMFSAVAGELARDTTEDIIRLSSTGASFYYILGGSGVTRTVSGTYDIVGYWD